MGRKNMSLRNGFHSLGMYSVVNLKTCYKASHLTRSHTEWPSEEVLEKFEGKKELLLPSGTRPVFSLLDCESHSSHFMCGSPG